MPNGYNSKRASEKRNAEFMSDVHRGRTANPDKKNAASENEKKQGRVQEQKDNSQKKKTSEDEIEITAKVTLAQFNAAAGDKNKIFNNTSDELLNFEDQDSPGKQDAMPPKVKQEEIDEHRVEKDAKTQVSSKTHANQKGSAVKQENNQLKEHRSEKQKQAACPVEDGRESSLVTKRRKLNQEEPKITNKIQEQKVNTDEQVLEPVTESPVVKQNVESANSATQSHAEPDQPADIEVPDFASLMSNPKINVTTNMKYNVPKLRPRNSRPELVSQESEDGIEKRIKLTDASETMAQEDACPLQEQSSIFRVSIADESLYEYDEDSFMMPEDDIEGMDDDYLDDEEATSLLTAQLSNNMIPAKVFPVLINAVTGERFRIDSTEFTIGHSKQCDLIIQEAGPKHKVSRQHATIYVRGKDTYMVDHSTNGTFIGSNPKDPASFIKMMKEQETQIKNGQYIKFATVVFRFERGEED